VSSILFSSRLSCIDFFFSPPLDFVAGLKADASSLCLNVISHARWAQRARERVVFQQDQGHLQTITFTTAFGCIVYIRTYTTTGIDLLSITKALGSEHTAILCLSLLISPITAPSVSCDLCLCTVDGFFNHSLSLKS